MTITDEDLENEKTELMKRWSSLGPPIVRALNAAEKYGGMLQGAKSEVEIIGLRDQVVHLAMNVKNLERLAAASELTIEGLESEVAQLKVKLNQETETKKE